MCVARLKLLVRNFPAPCLFNQTPNSKPFSTQPNRLEAVANEKLFFYHPDVVGEEFRTRFHNVFKVYENFISEKEEEMLLKEVEPHMKRLRYEFEVHWDNAIVGFRESEKRDWKKVNQVVIERIRQFAFENSKTPLIPHVHLLDLHEDGCIKPHVDAIRFCGDTIAGLSLLSQSVMRMVHEKEKQPVVDVLLPRRSLYITRDFARYDYTHEILHNKESRFRDQNIHKHRRISILLRNEAPCAEAS